MLSATLNRTLDDMREVKSGSASSKSRYVSHSNRLNERVYRIKRRIDLLPAS